jgi:iron complex transport system ATP-binding protein
MILRAENLTVEIAGLTIIDQLNLTISPGQSWAVLGRNGAGKSTLIHTLAGLLKPAAGSIWLGEDPIDKLTRRQVAQRLGILFQQEATPFPSTVEETVLTGRFPHLSEWQTESAEDHQRVEDALAVVELRDFGQRRSETLSGGERRRQDLAVLLVQDPELFFLDEPANHLDLRYQMLLLKHMRQLSHKQNKALFMALHDMNLATQFCDHCLLLHDSGEHEQGSIDKIINMDSLSRLYGHPVQQIATKNRTYWFPESL